VRDAFLPDVAPDADSHRNYIASLNNVTPVTSYSSAEVKGYQSKKDFFSHLGPIITSNLNDYEDILQERNCFIGQVNIVLCFFKQLNCATKIELFKSYCSSIFGSYGPSMIQE